MLDWLRKEGKAAKLEDVPASRRQKNYTALSGYAYEYFFEGRRDVGGAREYVFTVSGDRKTWFEVVVGVEDGGVAEWESARGRALATHERFAVAKLALQAAFDERESPAEMRERVRVDGAVVARILEELGVD